MALKAVLLARRNGWAAAVLTANAALACGGGQTDAGATDQADESGSSLTVGDGDVDSGDGDPGDGDGDGDPGDGDGDPGDGDGDPGDGDGDPIKFDSMLPDAGTPYDPCKVSEEQDGVGQCEMTAPPDAFEPENQWTFTDAQEPGSYVTPLVANLTDDDDNGEIDLCDVPDVVLVAGVNPGPPNSVGHIFVLSGDTGELHFRIPTDVDATFTPALGDIDNDGFVEIVTVQANGSLVAFAHDGALLWSTPVVWGLGDFFSQDLRYSNSAALADLDNDGDVEIVAANMIWDHEGTLLHTLPTIGGQWGATTLADLDDDGDLEIVLGSAAYHHDGTLLWSTNLKPGYPQVADLDDDSLPEVLLTNQNGVSLIEHDGTVTYQDLRPTGVSASGTNWHRPATIHDFDGDDQPEFAVSSASQYTVYEHDATILWTAPVQDASGIAAGTAFDFLGAGTAQAMYADEQNLFVFDGGGSVLLSVPRSSGTLSEYPVVADIDNDGSAEILVVSNQYNAGPDYACLRAIRDVEDRWIQARRIWNQHTYHVSNVREDGTIPQVEPHSWAGLNTFRTNAQIEGGGICEPAG